jgi:O-antigen/teichoic acid export membrane protein
MMNVIYYYYYLFYTKVLPDNQPHATVIFSLGFIISLIINGVINIVLAYKFGFALNHWGMIGVLALLIFILYLVFYKTGKGKIIVEVEKPKLFNSHVLSILLSLSLFIVGMLFLFFEADFTGNILNK